MTEPDAPQILNQPREISQKSEERPMSEQKVEVAVVGATLAITNVENNDSQVSETKEIARPVPVLEAAEPISQAVEKQE